jgi:hypothetical protein
VNCIPNEQIVQFLAIVFGFIFSDIDNKKEEGIRSSIPKAVGALMSHTKTLVTLMTLGQMASPDTVVEQETKEVPPLDGEWSTVMQDAFTKAQMAAAQKKARPPKAAQ